MSASPNKAKRARRVDHVSRPTMSMSSTNEAETIIDSSGNRWKRRLHSLRLSLTRRRIHSFIESDTAKEQNNPPEYPLGQRQTENTGVADVCFDNRYQSFSSNNRGQTYNGEGSPSNLNCKSKDVTVLDHVTASSNRASVKKRKGLSRHTKDGTLCDNKNRDTSQRNMPNDENKSVGRLGKPHNDGNRRRNRFGRKNAKNMLAFPSWFRSLGRSSAAKNSKHISRDLSLSAGNFNEEERNFKLLTDVQLLRDPGYVSSSGDSLDRENEDFHESKYQSLRRSRASLIDIRWHKHGHSEGNLASPKDTISRNKSPLLKTSCKSPSSPNVTAFQSPDLGSLERKLLFCNNNCDNGAGISKRDPSKGRRRLRENKPCSPKCPRITDSEQDISPGNTSKNCNRTPNKPEKDCLPDESRFEQNRQERSCHKSKSCSKHTEVEDVYLTADEDTNEQGEFKLCEESEHTHVKLTKKASPVNSREKRLPDSVSHEMVLHLSNHNSSRKERSVSWVNLPVAVLTDVNGNLKQLDKLEEPHILHMKQSENTVNNLQPCLSKVPKNLSKSQPLKTLPSSQNEVLDTYLNADVTTSVSALDKNNATSWKGATDMCQNCQAETGGVGVRGVQWNLCKFPSGHLNDNHGHQTPYMYCQRCKSSTRGQSRTDMYHDLVFIRPPKKPAPKPPSLIRNRCQSLTTLSGESPVLSEQLSLNETSSVHKLNDSCGENLYELMSQSKGKLQTSEGVYVGISGDQGVILRKKRVLPNPRAVSMPVELLGHVIKEAQGTETPNLSSADGSISELSNEHVSPSLSSGSDVYLNCNSNSPSPVVTNSKEKECCTRLLSISSIEVHELSVQKKANSQSVPCLVLKKDCVDSLKSIQGDHSMKRNFALSSENCFMEGHTDCCSNSSRPQSMISLNHREISNGDEDTNEKINGKPLMYAEALWDHVTMNEEELCFTAGQAIAVYDFDDPEWWFGLVEEHIGWFPASFVRIPVSGHLWNKYQNRVEQKLKGENGDKQFNGSRNDSNVCLSRDEVRCKILEEIVHTEEDYVHNLKDIVEGYLKQARKRPDMFSDKLLETIFSNIESIYHFHMDFLCCLQNQCGLNNQNVGKVGKAFLKYKQNFALYSEYCNNHPRASFELKVLLQQDKYRYFFEACRLLQDMIRISLDGFLLTPVQKICKYPLQLQELLKYTDPEHDDYDNVKKALEAMREVASCINEEKRKVENIQKIAEWQLGIEQWEGDDVLTKSSQLVHSGEVIKISKGRSQEVTLFLFDHQLVFCRKDIIKKRSLEYRGRMVLENYKFEKLEDGEVSHIGIPVNNAWRLSNKQSNTSCLFHTKTAEQRDKWIKYFLQERKIVYESTSANSIPLEERLAAMDAARNVLKSGKQIVKGEEKYGKFNTVSRALGQMYYGREDQRRKIDLPPPVSSAMLFQRNQRRSSFGLLRSPGVFRKKRPKATLPNGQIEIAQQPQPR